MGARAAKREQAAGPFAPELERLSRLAPELDPGVLVDAVSAMHVYRTYIDPITGTIADEDRAASASLPLEVAERLLGRRPAPPEFEIRFQQTTPAIMAKGVEDTAFYRYGRLLALNDVGGDPGRFGLEVDRFHEANATRHEHHPEGMLTTATHDTKRSGDTRARIAALSTMADEWVAAVERWLESTERLRSADGAPDDVERLFMFQTLVGVWPIELERLDQYLVKAMREAKRTTNWTSPDSDWERAVRNFARVLVDDGAFLADFEPFAARVAAAGERLALAQVVLKLTCPGVPDIYQGDELELLALVDPDNRRPVDWGLREAELRRLLGGGRPTRASIKLWTIARLLGLRARRPGPFAPGTSGHYEPLDAGARACAFLRGGEVLVVVERRRAPGVPCGAPPAGDGGMSSVASSAPSRARPRSPSSPASTGSRSSSGCDAGRCSGEMRVLLFSWEYPPVIEGGLGRHVRRLSESSSTRGPRSTFSPAAAAGSRACRCAAASSCTACRSRRFRVTSSGSSAGWRT